LSKIKELPKEQRPREKAYRYGLNSLSDDELLALIIGSGSVGFSALDLSTSLLRDFRGLNNLRNVSYQDFIKYKGLNKITALKLAAAFNLSKRITTQSINLDDTEITSEKLANKYSYLSTDEQETLILVVLDKKKRITYETALYKGTNNNIKCSFRDIYRDILAHNGYYFYLLHNHPNGESKPSSEDIDLTNDLFIAANRIDLLLLDHIIIARDGYYSLLASKTQ